MPRVGGSGLRFAAGTTATSSSTRQQAACPGESMISVRGVPVRVRARLRARASRRGAASGDGRVPCTVYCTHTRHDIKLISVSGRRLPAAGRDGTLQLKSLTLILRDAHAWSRFHCLPCADCARSPGRVAHRHVTRPFVGAAAPVDAQSFLSASCAASLAFCPYSVASCPAARSLPSIVASCSLSSGLSTVEYRCVAPPR